MTLGTKNTSRSRACALLATASALAMLAWAGTANASITVNGVTDTVPGTFATPLVIDGGLFVGTTGTGELDVNSGAQVTVTNCFYVDIGTTAGGVGTLKIDGAGTNFNNGACGSLIGESGAGTLSITNGAVFTTSNTNNAVNAVADGLNTTGTVTINGAGSTWNFANIQVGNSGTGTVTVSGGGTLNQASCSAAGLGNNSTGNGTITVTGAGSQWLNPCNGPGNLFNVGTDGTGTINVLAGGVVHGGQTELGVQADGTGSLTINGAGSKYLSNNFFGVGEGGKGTLQILNGGQLTDTQAQIAGLNSSALVDGAGSTWNTNSNGSLSVSGATSNLTITNGGVVTSTTGNSGGTVSIGGVGSQWTMTGNFAVGGATVGALNIMNGGLLSDGSASGAPGANAVANVTVDGAGSTWHNTTTTDFGGGFHSVFSMTLSNGGSLTDTTGNLETGFVYIHDAGSNWTNSGDLQVGTEGAGQVQLYNGGLLSVGGGTGTLILGGFGFGTGQLFIGGTNVPAQAPGTLAAATVNLRTASSTLDFHHNSSNYTFAPVIVGIGNLDNQLGVTVLTAANTYTGNTTIEGGTLLVNGSLANTPVFVAAGGSLGGSGSIGGIVGVSSNAHLIGVAGQSLTTGALNLGATANVDVSLGAPSAAGLFHVNGALTLDGVLNITDGGGFGAGLYRLFTYTGALTDNGLTIGTTPVGVLAANLTVQTSVANQVNLIYNLGGSNQFWDGSHTVANNTIAGGAGTWSAAPTNWTDSIGSTNGAWTGGFGIFEGAAGAVTIDNSGGAINATGLQFAVDGYSVGGGTLTLTGGAPTIRVGDGTANGAGYTTTINSVIAGSGLLKTDLGTLVLTGANTYTGGTVIQAGTLSVSADNNLGVAGTSVTVAGSLDTTASFTSNRTYSFSGNSSIVTTGGTTLNITGAVAGSGILAKAGAGTLVLSGSGAGFSGNIDDNAGVLDVNGVLPGSSITVVNGASLGGSGTAGGAIFINNGGHLVGVAGQELTTGLLSLGATSDIDVSLGAPSTSALFQVNGNLTLDGNLNITDAGGFGAGLYRIINYTGALTDNGLSIGTLPNNVSAGNLAVQTSVAGQVNLIYSAGALNFWNGSTVTPTGTVVGGDGTWSVGPHNWTDSAGSATGAWTGTIGIFMGAAGTVTVDNSGGAVNAQDLQFAVNGYSVGGGTLTLTGATPTIRVGDGTLAGSNDTATISAALAGTTGLIKTDLGKLVLSGANTYAGGTTILGGELTVGADANLGAATGSVTLNNASTLEISAGFTSNRAVVFAGNGAIQTDTGAVVNLTGVLSGSGVFDKTGAGELELSGVSTFASLASVDAGIMRVDGSIGGGLLVQSGARLQGVGQVNNASVLTGGTLAPGNSIGTFTVAGGLTFQTGSNYEVELNAAGQSDLTHVIGSTNIQGGTVDALAAAGTYFLGQQFTILTTDGGGLGGFASLNGGLNQPFVTLALGYDAHHVYLDVVRNSATFCSVAATRNQCAAAGGAESLGIGNVVYDSIASVPDVAGARAAFDALSGEAYASSDGIQLEDSRFVRDAAIGRLDTVRDGMKATWAQVFDAQGSTDSDGNAGSVKRTVGGFLIGADEDIGHNWRVGALAGYSQTRFSIGSRDSSGTSDDYHLGGYAGLDGGPLKARFGVAYSWHDISTGRAVFFPGFAEGEQSSHRSGDVQAFGELAYPMIGKAQTIEPFANVAYVALHSDAFAEHGGAAALKLAGSDPQVTFATIGVRGEVRTDAVTLRGSLAWRAADGDLTAQNRMMFASGGSAFNVNGAPIAHGAMVANINLGVDLTKRARLSVDYAGQTGGGAQDQSVKLGLNVGF